MNISGIVAFFGLPGGMELVLLAFIILLLFGGQKLPSLMRNLGRSANEFKRGMSDKGEDADTNEKKGE
jgi:sec-independent protein translocase protein TatA